MTLSQKPGLGSRLSDLSKAVARFSPRKKLAVILLGVFVVLTWLAACAVLASLFV
jgi:flagellar basal body-associated protein FliL